VNSRGLLITALLVTASYAEDSNNHYPFAAGKIEKMDLSARQITIHAPDGLQTYVVTERTYVYRGKEKLSFEKLRVGDFIKLNYFTNETGQVAIRRLKVDQPPTP
jgi:Cu/Ag efflux protein CusF